MIVRRMCSLTRHLPVDNNINKVINRTVFNRVRRHRAINKSLIISLLPVTNLIWLMNFNRKRSPANLPSPLISRNRCIRLFLVNSFTRTSPVLNHWDSMRLRHIQQWCRSQRVHPTHRPSPFNRDISPRTVTIRTIRSMHLNNSHHYHDDSFIVRHLSIRRHAVIFNSKVQLMSKNGDET